MKRRRRFNAWREAWQESWRWARVAKRKHGLRSLLYARGELDVAADGILAGRCAPYVTFWERRLTLAIRILRRRLPGFPLNDIGAAVRAREDLPAWKAILHHRSDVA